MFSSKTMIAGLRRAQEDCSTLRRGWCNAVPLEDSPVTAQSGDSEQVGLLWVEAAVSVSAVRPVVVRTGPPI